MPPQSPRTNLHFDEKRRNVDYICNSRLLDKYSMFRRFESLPSLLIFKFLRQITFLLRHTFRLAVIYGKIFFFRKQSTVTACTIIPD